MWLCSMGFSASQFFIGFQFQFVVLSCLWLSVSSFGSMSPIAASFGYNSSALCYLRSDGSHTVACNGTDTEIIQGTPQHYPFLALAGGYGFVCGLLMNSSQPYCWGSHEHIRERMGVPQPVVKGAQYSEISAGEYHLCGLRKPLRGKRQRNNSFVDCWGFNMTGTYVFDAQIQSISAGSGFNCALFSHNKTVFCWGHDLQVIRSIPRGSRFQKIAAGGYHVCGILEGSNSRAVCWGRNTTFEDNSILQLAPDDVLSPSNDSMISIVSGRYHACGIKRNDHGIICWGFPYQDGTLLPNGTDMVEIAAGDYFTCGMLVENYDQPFCWGANVPSILPLFEIGICAPTSCPSGFYEMVQNKHNCSSSNPHFCFPCTTDCPLGMYQTSGCNLTSDIICEHNCSDCLSNECSSYCHPVPANEDKHERFWSKHVPVVFFIILTVQVACTAFLFCITSVFCAHCKLRAGQCSGRRSKATLSHNSSSQRESNRIRPDLEEFRIGKAKRFTYEELEKATGGFKQESIVGKGSFSCVFRGVLEDGTAIAVKRAVRSANMPDNSNDFHTELDLLSRLNHAHLLTLLGYCEEDGEIILVYEFMANGSLHQHLHGQNKELKSKLDWVKRVTIAVQAARGIEYLHAYAFPPVIHRDIKSSNILIDEEHNARVADFGLSLLGPADSNTPLSEVPAGTLGYLDPEYYRLHYLTTKSDVYSFGVLLLELLSGRKAIDMKFEEGNIVQWAKPLIKSGDITAILDPVLKPPDDLAALKKIAIVACKSVKMTARDRPSMDQITTVLERALAQLLGSPCGEQPILPTEVVLGSSRLQMRSSLRSSNRSEINVAENEDKGLEFRAPSGIKSSGSEAEADVDVKKNAGGKNNAGEGGGGGDVLISLEEEIGPASPQ